MWHKNFVQQVIDGTFNMLFLAPNLTFFFAKFRSYPWKVQFLNVFIAWTIRIREFRILQERASRSFEIHQKVMMQFFSMLLTHIFLHSYV